MGGNIGGTACIVVCLTRGILLTAHTLCPLDDLGLAIFPRLYTILVPEFLNFNSISAHYGYTVYLYLQVHLATTHSPVQP